MLEPGEVKSLTEIAKREGVDNSYVSRMVNLTTLAPDIVAAILDDTLPDHVTLLELAADPPVLWGAVGANHSSSLCGDGSLLRSRLIGRHSM
jgi:hypothetical protein